MTSIAYSHISIQTSAHSVPSLPCWFGEITLLTHHLQRQGVLAAIEEQVRFARRRFGRYEVIDFLAVLLGYAMSGERTLEAFYARINPWASAFMALFGRDRLPARATLSRFLAALDQTAVESLRTLFLKDLLARPLEKEEQLGGLVDRQGNHYLVFDVDGTREAARQRALPQTADRPAPQRRLRPVCAPGHLGRKRGEVVRTRTTILQAHTHQFLGTFGNPGNGQYRDELKQARNVIATYAHALSFPLSHVVVWLDGLYGNAAPLADLLAVQAGEVEGPAVVVRGKDYHLIERPAIQQRLKLPPDQLTVHPESGASRALYDCGPIQLAPTGPTVRMLLAPHPVGSSRPSIG